MVWFLVIAELSSLLLVLVPEWLMCCLWAEVVTQPEWQVITFPRLIKKETGPSAFRVMSAVGEQS